MDEVMVPDNTFFSFTEIMEIPLKTLVKTSVAKQELLTKLN